MERGVTREIEGIRQGLRFFIPGPPAKPSFVAAFKQGLSGEGDHLYNIVGMRCSGCGYLELYAE